MSERKLACLYIEDDPMSREVMRLLITQLMGYELTIFENSDHFLERTKALPFVPDMIFLDIHIGPHDGYEMLRLLQGMQHLPAAPLSR